MMTLDDFLYNLQNPLHCEVQCIYIINFYIIYCTTFVVSSKGKFKTWVLCYVRPLFQESFTHNVFILYIKTYASFGLCPQGRVNALMQVIGDIFWFLCYDECVNDKWKH
jgi:hypothetical protein